MLNSTFHPNKTNTLEVHRLEEPVQTPKGTTPRFIVSTTLVFLTSLLIGAFLPFHPQPEISPQGRFVVSHDLRI